MIIYSISILSVVCFPPILSQEPPMRDPFSTDTTVKPTSSNRPNQKANPLIDALANSNQAPRIVRLKQRTVPAFPVEYDWNEYARVLKALAAVNSNESEDFWEDLVRHCRDSRYSITLVPDGPFAKNFTVGELCEKRARSQLFYVFGRLRTVDVENDFLRLNLDIGGLEHWREERATKRLYELQIELCNDALNELRISTEIPETRKAALKEQLERDISEISRTKKGVYGRSSMDGYSKYDAEKAKAINEQIEKK